MWVFCFFPPSTEKQIWYFAGWKKSATTADLCCAAPTSRAALTPWLMSTVCWVKRADLPSKPGTALYMKVAPPAWRSSSLYSATHTATPNSDETGVWRWAEHLFFYSLAKWHRLIDVLCHSTLQQVSHKWLVRFENQESREKKTKNSEFFGHSVKATEKRIFVWPTFIIREKI